MRSVSLSQIALFTLFTVSSCTHIPSTGADITDVPMTNEISGEWVSRLSSSGSSSDTDKMESSDESDIICYEDAKVDQAPVRNTTISSSVEIGDGYIVYVYDEPVAEKPTDLLDDLISIVSKLPSIAAFHDEAHEELAQDLLYAFCGRPVPGYELNGTIPEPLVEDVKRLVLLMGEPDMVRRAGAEWAVVVGRMAAHPTRLLGAVLRPGYTMELL